MFKKIFNYIKNFFHKKETPPTPPDLGISVSERVESKEIFGRP